MGGGPQTDVDVDEDDGGGGGWLMCKDDENEDDDDDDNEDGDDAEINVAAVVYFAGQLISKVIQYVCS
jgi:hypothetical protein